jgi:hypothetical protein
MGNFEFDNGGNINLLFSSLLVSVGEKGYEMFGKRVRVGCKMHFCAKD